MSMVGLTVLIDINQGEIIYLSINLLKLKHFDMFVSTF